MVHLSVCRDSLDRLWWGWFIPISWKGGWSPLSWLMSTLCLLPLIPHVTMRTFALQYIEENNLHQAQPCFGRMQKCQDKTSAKYNTTFIFVRSAPIREEIGKTLDICIINLQSLCMRMFVFWGTMILWKMVMMNYEPAGIVFTVYVLEVPLWCPPSFTCCEAHKPNSLLFSKEVGLVGL